MNIPGVAALLRRRGIIVLWQHGEPPVASSVSQLTQELAIVTGAKNPPTTPTGPLGETYTDPVAPIRALYSNRVTDVAFWGAGLVNTGDAQLDIAVPFSAEPFYGVNPLSPTLLAAFNSGGFFTLDRGGQGAVDYFLIYGERWNAKAMGVPLTDAGVVFAYRILISKAEF